MSQMFAIIMKRNAFTKAKRTNERSFMLPPFLCIHIYIGIDFCSSNEKRTTKVNITSEHEWGDEKVRGLIDIRYCSTNTNHRKAFVETFCKR